MRSRQTRDDGQLKWAAHVVQYVNTVWKMSKHGQNELKRDIPLFGPRFIPPTYRDAQRRELLPNIEPSIMYLRPLNVVHPFYYPELASCPQCGSSSIGWEGWTGHGHCEVHGVRCEETALGFQLLCKDCKLLKPKGSREFKCTWATTNVEFWEKHNH